MLGERKEMERSTKKAEIANAQYTHDIMISSWWEFHLICQNAVSYLPQKSRKTAWEESLMYQTWGSPFLFVILLIIFIDFMPFCGVTGSPKGIPGVNIFPSRLSLYHWLGASASLQHRSGYSNLFILGRGALKGMFLKELILSILLETLG